MTIIIAVMGVTTTGNVTARNVIATAINGKTHPTLTETSSGQNALPNTTS